MIDSSCREIIEALDIQCFVETGTDMAETAALVTGWFARMDPTFGKITSYAVTGESGYSLQSAPIEYPVFEGAKDSAYKYYSVDLDPHCYQNARQLFKTNSNVTFALGNSTEFLSQAIARDQFPPGRTMFFLDAHWGKYWPLRDELRRILTLEKCIIVIDDFFVPNRSNRKRPHSDFGFDFYHGRVLDWAYISDLFAQTDVNIYYPTRPNRDSRGFVVLFKGYCPDDLSFINDMSFIALDKDDSLHRLPTPLSPLAYLDFRYLVRSMIPLSLLRSCIRTVQKLSNRHRQNHPRGYVHDHP